jgi:hypothetical protein
MRKRVLIGIALFAAVAVNAADQTAAPPDEYVVWVDGLELRTEASMEGAVITTLARGTRLLNISEAVTGIEGQYWRHVGAGEYDGWVIDRNIIPAYFYEPFKRADELGKAGDAEGMVGAVAEAVERFELSYPPEGPLYSVSPDGRKVFIDVSYPFRPDWRRAYPSKPMLNYPVPVLYFVSGTGLTDYLLLTEYSAGKWSDDSRYYVYLAWRWIEFIDTENRDVENLGEIYYFIKFQEVEFVGDYFIWMTWESTIEPELRMLDVIDMPVLLAYDVVTGERKRVLQANPATLKSEVIPGRNYDYYGVKMVPAEDCPERLKKAKLYKKFNREYARGRSSNA